MFVLQNSVFLTIEINGQDIGFMPNGLVNFTAVEGNNLAVPQLQIILFDQQSTLTSTKALAEGNKVVVTVARSVNDNQIEPRKYRIFNTKTENYVSGPVLIVNCVLDAPRYIAASANEAHKGTSDTAIKKIAEYCGLRCSTPKDFNSRTMADDQTWLNVGKSRAAFVRNICRHSWMDEYSGMSVAVTSFGEIRFRNVVDAISIKEDKIAYVFLHNAIPSDAQRDKKTYLVQQATDRSLAGTTNTWTNYGTTRVSQPLSGKTNSIEKLDVKVPGAFLSRNKVVAEDIKRARYEYAPLDCGNTHEKHEEGLYQNLKILGLFSERLSLLVYEVTEVQIYDAVIYRQADCDLSTPVKNTDIYLVVGKTIVCPGGTFYAERLELARMSLTMDGSNELTKPGEARSEREMLPDMQLDNGGTSAASTLGAARSTSAAMQAVTDSTNLLQSAKASVSNAISPLTTGVAAIGAAITQGTSTLIGSTVGAVLPMMNNLLAVANQVAGLTSSAKTLSGDLVAQGSSYKQQMKSAVTFGKGGLLDNTVAQMTNVSALRSSVNSLKTVKDSVPTSLNLAQLNQYSSTLGSLDHTVTNAESNIVGQWNGNLAYATGATAVPANIAESASNTLKNRLSTITNIVQDDSAIKRVVGNAWGADSGQYITPKALEQQRPATVEQAAETLSIQSERLQC